MGMGSIATSGMQAAMNDMSIISNNIANANTTGFKQSSATFADVFPSGNASAGPQIGLGVDLSRVSQDFRPGQTRETGVGSNMAITGPGFFMLKDATTNQAAYTRNGEFKFNQATGYFMLGNQRLQGFAAVNGVIPAGAPAGDLKIDTSPMPPQPTTKLAQANVNLGSNELAPATTPFDPNNTSTYNFQSSAQVFDSLGNANTINIYYVRPSNGSLTWNVYGAIGSTVLNPSSPGTMTFNTSGTMTSSSNLSLSFSPTSGAAAPQTVALDMTGTTQNAGGNMAGQITPKDGYAAGVFDTYAIDGDGNVSALYKGNGKRTVVAQVALANFSSPQGLQYAGDATWTATNDSGVAMTSPANSTGMIKVNSIEASNVDMASELVALINAQSTFQANAQVEQTYNQVMQTVTKL